MLRKFSKIQATEEEAKFFFRQIVTGQQALHQAGVYHVDVKLTNMMVTNDDVVKIIDFGLSELNDEEMFGSVGADGYYCPEMVLHGVFHPSMIDPWNDGICLYKMMYGDYTFGSRYL